MQINFFHEDAKFPSGLRKTSFRSVVQVIVQNESKKKIEYINFIAGSDNYVLGINQNYLKHDYYTDVITFDYEMSEMPFHIRYNNSSSLNNAITVISAAAHRGIF